MVTLMILLMVVLATVERTTDAMATNLDTLGHHSIPETLPPLTNKKLSKNFSHQIGKKSFREKNILSSDMESNRKSDDLLVGSYLKASQCGTVQFQTLVDKHNELRSKVNPPAADMEYMEWSAELAESAQTRADECDIKRDFPPEEPSEIYGQNSFWLDKSDGNDTLKAVTSWYAESDNYDLQLQGCVHNETCHHYTQVVWASSKYIGCGLTNKCNDGKNSLLVCLYFPRGNIGKRNPYTIGLGCSLCPDFGDGGLCFNNACVTRNVCQDHDLKCDCPLRCYNCGELDSYNCRCKCTEGWDGLDCSVPCMNVQKQCEEDDGYRHEECANDEVRNVYCRRMCGECTSMNSLTTIPNATCCDGVICNSGYTLDENCKCVIKCPGLLCITDQGEGNTGGMLPGRELWVEERSGAGVTDLPLLYPRRKRYAITEPTKPPRRCADKAD